MTWIIHRRIIPTIVTIALVPILVSLGYWQLDRAEQKRHRLESYLQRGHAPAQRLSPSIIDAESLINYRVVVTGHYDPERQFLLDNRVLHGQPGYHVLTPLRIVGGNTRVLVNRGWVAWGDDRRILPKVPPPDGLVRVEGRATVPSDHYFTLERRTTVPAHWDARWQNLDLGRFVALVDFPVQPIVVELDPISNAGGLVREWTVPDAEWVQRHRAYAFQWFALALTLVVLYIVIMRKEKRIAPSA